MPNGIIKDHVSDPQVTLNTCDSEPIHIPGLIQPHGCMGAFDRLGKLVFASGNARALIGLMSDAALDAQPLPRALLADMENWTRDRAKSFAAFNVAINHQHFDVVGHRNDDNLLIVEFEPSQSETTIPPGGFPVLLHRAMERFRRQTDIDELLGMVTEEVRTITGFDRVMAYRFRHDDSGEVVRESRRMDLEDWQGHRYPSSDIPAQARRLYVLNTLRLIADVHAVSTPVESFDTHDSIGRPRALDMSFCVLRSVSPIHIEYLMNMGVAASLSISIVVDGKLWGMIACHHGAPRHVSHGVRMACEVLGQMVAITIGGLLAADLSRRLAQTTSVLASIGIRTRAADDLLFGLATGLPNPSSLLSADATVCLWGGRALRCTGTISPSMVTALATALELVDKAHDMELLSTNQVSVAYPNLAVVVKPYCGLHAVCFDVAQRGWIVWLRLEQIEHVRWAGKPWKQMRSGPLGPRLTPRGSFEEWREEVRETSVPWEASDVRAAEALRAELSRIASVHAMELEKARHHLLATLGHDLREPLHAISLAASILTRQGDVAEKLGNRIASSSSRMSRLVTQILDMSLLQSRSNMALMRKHFDLVALLREVVSDANFSYPGNEIQLVGPAKLMVNADRDRLSQVLTNLLSNARHHGTPGQPVTVFAEHHDGMTKFGVANSGKPIDATTQADLFKPFKSSSRINPLNRTGLGLGLYIASEILKAHKGRLELSVEHERIIFTANLADAIDGD